MNENLDPTTQHLSASDKEFERAIRPAQFTDFQGQKQVLENLMVFVHAAKGRGEALDHVLLHGPPGLGKTTLSHIIGNEMGVNVRVTSGPVIDKPGDLAGLLTNLEPHDVLFLVGATTRSGLLTAPLRSRFGINLRLQYYDAQTLGNIIKRSASILDIPIDEDAAYEIASRSRGTPRIANLLLRRVRDFAQIKGDGTITLPITQIALTALNVDQHGLDEMDNRILSTIIEKFKGGPVGLSTIATAVGEDPGTIEEVYEPFLIQEGYLMRTPRGREATDLAFSHLGKSRYVSGQGELF